MYRPKTSNRDRAGTIIIVIAIHAALAFALLNLSGRLTSFERPDETQLIDLVRPPPSPPIVEKPPPEKAKSRQKEGAAAPKNLESRATPVVRVEPKVVIPVPSPIVTAPVANTGVQASQGAAPTPGPGSGAGGSGTGTGSGGSGDGSGGGGDGGVAARPALVRGITNRDYPAAIQRAWPRGGQVFVRVRVEASGRPSRCDVMRSFGNSAVDGWTCSLVMARALFRPAADARGQPISAWFGYVQSDQGRFDH